MSSKAPKRSSRRKSTHTKIRRSKLTNQQIKELKRIIRTRKRKGDYLKKLFNKKKDNTVSKKAEAIMDSTQPTIAPAVATVPTTTPTPAPTPTPPKADNETTQKPKKSSNISPSTTKSFKPYNKSSSKKKTNNNSSNSSLLTSAFNIGAALAGYGPHAAAVQAGIGVVKSGVNKARSLATKAMEHKRVLKAMLNTNPYVLTGTGLARANDVINRWKNTRMKTRLDYAPYYQDIIADATKRQNELIEKQNKYIEDQRKKYERIGGAPLSDLKRDEFGKIVDPLSGNYIQTVTYKPFQFSRSDKRDLTTKEKEDVYVQHLQRAKYNKEYHLKTMEKLKNKVDEPNALIEQRINDISDEYKNLVKYETHDFVSHPEEIMFSENNDRITWQKYINTMRTAIKTVADVSRLANDKLNPVGGAIDLIKKKLKGVRGADDATAEADRLQKQIIDENNKYVDKYEKEANSIINFVNNNKDIVDKSLNNYELIEHQPYATPSITLADVLANDNTINSFAETYDNPYRAMKQLEKIAKQLDENVTKQHYENVEKVKSYWEKTIEGAKSIANSAYNSFKSLGSDESLENSFKDMIDSIQGVSTFGPSHLNSLKSIGKNKSIGTAAKDAVIWAGTSYADAAKLLGGTFYNSMKLLGNLGAYPVKWGWNKLFGSNGKALDVTDKILDAAQNALSQWFYGLTDEEIVRIKKERGEQYDDKWNKLFEEDVPELSLKDMLTNLKKHKELGEEYKKLNMKDIVGFNELGVDFRLKNEYITSPILKQAHKAFINGDENEKAKLRILGIYSTDDLRKRKNDLYEYLLLRGQDTSDLNDLFETYAGLPQREYEKKVLEPINQLKKNRNIDATESIANKLLKISTIYQGVKDLNKELVESRLKLFDSREGIDAEANNNRIRDLITEVFRPENKAEKTPTENKMKNKIIAQLTSLMSQDGFMSYEEEKELMSNKDLGKSFFMYDPDSSIFDADNLKNDNEIKSAYNQINNYVDYRRHYMRANNILATQKTFNEIATGNTGQNFLAKTQGTKYNDIDDVVKKTVFNDKSSNEKDPEQWYEKNKRQSHFKAAIEANPTNMITIMQQIDDPKKITLKQLKEITERANGITNNQELINYGRMINENIENIDIDSKKNDYRWLNDRDVAKAKNYANSKKAEYQDILRPSRTNKINDVSKLPLNKVVKENDKYLFKTKNEIGDVITTEVDPENKKQYLYAYNENNNPQTINETVSEHNMEISKKGKQELHKFMNNPKGYMEANIQQIAYDSGLKISTPHEYSHDYTPQLKLAQNNNFDTPQEQTQLAKSNVQEYEIPEKQINLSVKTSNTEIKPIPPPTLKISKSRYEERKYIPVYPEISEPTTFEMAHEYKPQMELITNDTFNVPLERAQLLESNPGMFEIQYEQPRLSHANTILFQQPIPTPVIQESGIIVDKPKKNKYKRAPHRS